MVVSQVAEKLTNGAPWATVTRMAVATVTAVIAAYVFTTASVQEAEDRAASERKSLAAEIEVREGRNEARLDELSERVAAIVANRFTPADGMAVWQEIGDLRTSIARLPSEVPPRWFLDKVELLDRRLLELERKDK